MLSLPLALALAFSPQLPAEWIDAFLEGSRALEQGEVQGALESLTRVQELLPGHAPSAYLLACAHARAGDPEAALGWLERVRAAGTLDRALLEWDPWLDPLRGDPRFAELAAEAPSAAPGPEAPDHELVRHDSLSGFATIGVGPPLLVISGAGLLDLSTGELCVALVHPDERVMSAVVDPRGHWVAISGTHSERRSNRSGRFLRVHDAATGELLHDLGDPGSSAHLQVDAGGARLLSRVGQDGAVQIFETEGWSRLPSPPSGNSEALLSPDGRVLMMVFRWDSNRAQIWFWNVAEGHLIGRQQNIARVPSGQAMGFDQTGAFAFVVDGRQLMTRLFDARTGTRLEVELRSTTEPSAARVLPRGDQVAVLEEDAIAFFALRTGALLRRVPLLGDGGLEPGARGERWDKRQLPRRITGFADVSGDGERLLLFEARGSLVLLDARTGRIAWELTDGDSGGRHSARFLRGDREVLRAREGAVERRDADTGKLLARIAAGQLGTTVAMAGSSARTWIGAGDGSLRELDVNTGRTLRILRVSDTSIAALELDRQGSRIALVDDRGRMQTLDAHSGALLSSHPLPALDHGRRPFLRLASTGRRALVGWRGDATALVELEHGEKRASFRGGLCWSPDGSRFAARGGDPSSVQVLAGDDGARMGQEMRVDGSITSVAFDPSGDRLWVATDRSEVHVLDISSGESLRRLDLSDLDFDPVRVGSINFSPNGDVGVTASRGFGVVAGWDVGSGELLWDFTYNGWLPSSIETAFGEQGESVYAYGQGQWTPRVVDARTGEMRLDLADRGIDRLWPLPGEERILASTARGLEVLEAGSGRTLWSRVELANEGWLLRTPGSGHVDGTRAALEALHLALEGRSLPLDALAAVLLDPAKVRAGAAGVVVAPAELDDLPTLDWRERQPRVLVLGEDRPTATLVLEAGAPGGIVGFEQRVDGQWSFLPGEAAGDEARAAGASQRRALELELERPPPGTDREHRWRAIAAGGLASRALYLRVERR